MPRPPHLALMCVRQLTDRLSKRSGGMGNCRKKGGFSPLFHFFSQISGIFSKSFNLMAWTVVTSQNSSFLS